MIGGWSISYIIVPMWLSLSLTGGKPALVQATSHYLNQYWPCRHLTWLDYNELNWNPAKSRTPITTTTSVFVAQLHYNDVIMGAIASQITSLTMVYSTVYSGADQRRHQSSVSLAFVRGIHRWPVNSPHKWPVTRKMFPFDDVIMVLNLTQSMTVSLPGFVHNFLKRLSNWERGYGKMAWFNFKMTFWCYSILQEARDSFY